MSNILQSMHARQSSGIFGRATDEHYSIRGGHYRLQQSNAELGPGAHGKANPSQKEQQACTDSTVHEDIGSIAVQSSKTSIFVIAHEMINVGCDDIAEFLVPIARGDLQKLLDIAVVD